MDGGLRLEEHEPVSSSTLYVTVSYMLNGKERL